jgi:hypothetical protein
MKPKFLLLAIVPLLFANCTGINSESLKASVSNPSTVLGPRKVIGVEVDVLSRRVGAGVWVQPKS